jgi:hypothetical protein
MDGNRMRKETNHLLLLLLILAFAFSYRLALMTWNTYPPGADIGLHESVMKSITIQGTGFSWNYFHMGGGVSATNPGYHIFVAAVQAFTGVSDYLALATVAAFFSALIALCAFLVVRFVWNEKAAFIAAFLVAFSSGDIAILVWGGYPNVATLMLIPIVFYLFLQRGKFSRGTYLAATSILVGAMFLTHVFSAFVFTTITIITLAVATLLTKKTRTTRTHIVAWLLPVAIGAALVSPYLIQNVPVYFGSEGAVTDAASAMKQALLETRLIPATVVLLSLIPAALVFVLSRINKGKFITTATVLSAAWILVPAVLTQSYLFGIYLDYERFLYFLFLPIIISTAVLIESGSHTLSRLLNRLTSRAKKTAYPAFILSLTLISLLFVPIFTTPNAAIDETNSFQTMTSKGYEAIQWIKTNTAPDAVFVADANYGWWLSGFAQRPTLSAVDPQYLILSREFAPAKAATNLLQTDYFIDNGLIRVSQNSPHAKDSPTFSGWLNNSYLPYQFFSLNETAISVLYRQNNSPQHEAFSQPPNADVRIVNSADHASFIMTRQNQLFNSIEETTIYEGTRFAKVSITLQANTAEVGFDWLHVPFNQKGLPKQYVDTIATVDGEMHVLSQIILPENQLGSDVVLRENPNSYELVFSLDGKNTVQVQFYVGLCPIPADAESDALQGLVANNTKTYLTAISDLPLDYFDYKATIEEWNVSYIVARDSDAISRLANDSLFSLVFKNSEIAIFKVTKTT